MLKRKKKKQNKPAKPKQTFLRLTFNYFLLVIVDCLKCSWKRAKGVWGRVLCVPGYIYFLLLCIK